MGGKGNKRFYLHEVGLTQKLRQSSKTAASAVKTGELHGTDDAVSIKSILAKALSVNKNPKNLRGKKKYSTDQAPGVGVTLSNIQSCFKGQHVFLSPDGSISIRLKNGKGLTIKSVKEIGGDDIQFAMRTGRMGKNGVILGKYQNRTITINKDLASNFTRDHELFHFLKDMGMITKGDSLALALAMRKMQSKGSLTFKVSGIKEENGANTFAQVLQDRKIDRETLIGRII